MEAGLLLLLLLLLLLPSVSIRSRRASSLN